MTEEHYEGAKAADYYYNSQGFSALTRDVMAEDAVKLFLPPLVESLTQVAAPMPKNRKDWIKGFKQRQLKILEENKHER